ncbi:RTA1-domain-containing protein [Pleomassaria siparia CBS 279.74]|uniref:RTA1-domain-containing protein n=1 Tax=Pleomassaria siparia CBS 279.74 TaxID=1314801 RepID=A0A6G1KKY6_9PLEO|nr:RTA1-domain-containing protein [Pleomassaria siparia CBS 279.74]
MPHFNPSTCIEVGPAPGFPNLTCTIQGTLYGYAPSLAANAFFIAFFALCLIIQLVLGIKYKTWTYMIALGFGCLGETIGYIGRIMLHNDPFSGLGFQIQICCLIICPAFISGGIYLTLKHIVLNFGQNWSRLRPTWYTYIFITGDIFSLVLQGAGGGIAATADNGSTGQDLGTDLMIAGVVFQVVVLAFFGVATVEYAMRCHRHRGEWLPESHTLYHDSKFRAFCGAILLAYTCILIRCAYRIPELTGGWGSDLMRNQAEFIGLEGVMIVLAVLGLTVCHPGYCFPAMSNTIGSSSRREKVPSRHSGDEMKVLA